MRTLAAAGEPGSLLGVDMPIGLPDRERRACDREARRFLAPRGSTVFPAPCRPVLESATYAEANAMSREVSGRGISRQTYALVPKIREADALARQHRSVVEIHPECAFGRMAGHVLASKHSTEGLAARAALVVHHFGPVDLAHRPTGCGVDDVLDAYAVLWSAQRYAAGEHVEFGDGSVDSVGLPMRIVS